MKPIDKNELFEHMSSFLKGKGIHLQEGAYTEQLQKSCGLLADTVNLSQKTLERAKEEMDKRLKQVQQVIHEATAPESPPTPPQPPPANAKAGASKPGARKSPQRKAGPAGRKPRK